MGDLTNLGQLLGSTAYNIADKGITINVRTDIPDAIFIKIGLTLVLSTILMTAGFYITRRLTA